MRLVFISSVTAITPLRTISTITGSSFSFSLGRFLRHHFAPATAITRLPQASTVMRSPGISTVVEACSSISAGPLILLPASSSARR